MRSRKQEKAAAGESGSGRSKRTASSGRLSWEQRRFLAVLGLPAFGIAFAYTLVSTYLPVIIHQLSGPTVTGVLIGGEGIFALFLPIVVGFPYEEWNEAAMKKRAEALAELALSV